ncbi:hypothetical protein [Deinococcus arcticus]|uniref:hypothetical protein n=1 Tax=Deinococcus arcticus TaxID=2136176 RepID=UPI0011B283B9|nr:hypothetical protein [Deinococcus arcticus]
MAGAAGCRLAGPGTAARGAARVAQAAQHWCSVQANPDPQVGRAAAVVLAYVAWRGGQLGEARRALDWVGPDLSPWV